MQQYFQKIYRETQVQYDHFFSSRLEFDRLIIFFSKLKEFYILTRFYQPFVIQSYLFTFKKEDSFWYKKLIQLSFFEHNIGIVDGCLSINHNKCVSMDIFDYFHSHIYYRKLKIKIINRKGHFLDELKIKITK